MRHHHVQQDRLGGDLLNDPQRLVASRRPNDDHAMARQVALEEFDQALIVVDDENGGRLGCGQGDLRQPRTGRFLERQASILRCDQRFGDGQRHPLAAMRGRSMCR